MRPLPIRSPAAALLAACLVSGSARAQAQQEEPRPWSLDLTVHDVGIGIGNSRHIDGLRLNFRDTAPFQAHGVNATIWVPGKGAENSEVDGLALGLPLTGAGTIRGLAVGIGLYAAAIVSTVALLVALFGLRTPRRWLNQQFARKHSDGGEEEEEKLHADNGHR